MHKKSFTVALYYVTLNCFMLKYSSGQQALPSYEAIYVIPLMFEGLTSSLNLYLDCFQSAEFDSYIN